jgi:uncharacterized coiled-coil DUF342 family protein
MVDEKGLAWATLVDAKNTQEREGDEFPRQCDVDFGLRLLEERLSTTMSESEQSINVSEWKELHADLEEVREKRDRLQAENNRLKTLMQLTRRECEYAKNELVKMTAERDAVKEANGSANRMIEALQGDFRRWQVEYDAAKEQLSQAKEAADMFAAENTSLQDTVRQLRAKQIHDDLPGILRAIQLAVEQARELI